MRPVLIEKLPQLLSSPLLPLSGSNNIALARVLPFYTLTARREAASTHAPQLPIVSASTAIFL
jgi:hypothetical protein